MGEIQLSLECYQSSPLLLDLYEKSPVFDLLNISSCVSNKVYSDKKYIIKLVGDCSNILETALFVNGFDTEARYYNGELKISDDKSRVFIDTFGFVQLSLSVTYNDNSHNVYYSEFLNVMIKENYLNQSIRKMADYIYINQEKLLLDDKMKALDNANLKESLNKTLESQLKIIKTVILSYKENYRYFKNNSKFKLIANNRVDDFEKLRIVNDKTIKYIIQNPNELYLSENSTGIKIDKDYYLPKKTLINDNKQSVELYENQVILSFLAAMVNDISLMQEDVKNKISVFGEIKTEENGYMISAYMIYGATEKKFRDFLTEITVCKDEIIELFKMYSIIFPFKCIEINDVPKPTHTFLTVRQYNSIFQVIKEWYKFGIYNMERENFLIPFLANNQLYEYFVLLKLLNYLEYKGYSFLKKDRYLYKPNAKNYQNTKYCNTFYFQLRDKKITLYYQPVIYLKPNVQSNNINLLRNTAITMNKSSESGNKYYLPDFILKVQTNDENRYFIADAKYSNQNNVKGLYFPELAYKYIFSLTSLGENDKIMGLCAINGKSDTESSKLTSIYTDYIPKNQLPYADILTLTEDGNVSDENEISHWELLSELLGKYSV